MRSTASSSNLANVSAGIERASPTYPEPDPLSGASTILKKVVSSRKNTKKRLRAAICFPSLEARAFARLVSSAPTRPRGHPRAFSTRRCRASSFREHCCHCRIRWVLLSSLGDSSHRGPSGAELLPLASHKKSCAAGNHTHPRPRE